MKDYAFHDPLWLLALLILPLLNWVRGRRGAPVLVVPFAAAWHRPSLILTSRWPAALALTGLILLIGALARPQIVEDKREVKQQGYDLMLAIDLSGSMLVAAGVSAALGVIMVLLRGATFQPEQYAWLVLTSTLGSWFVLAPAKLWEGTRGDTSLRRFGLMLLGLGLGAVTWGLDRYLWVDLSYEMLTTAGAGKSLGHSFYDPQGQPQLFAYLAYFGFLFLLPRWWRQADPLRSTRVSLWSTGVCVVVAMALNLIWPFPQPWGLMAAATTSLAVQLSSPWQDKRLLKVRRQS